MSKAVRVLRESNLIDVDEPTLLGALLDLARRLDADADRYRHIGVESRIRRDRDKPGMVEVCVELPFAATDQQKRWLVARDLMEWSPQIFRGVVAQRKLAELTEECRSKQYEIKYAGREPLAPAPS